MSGFLYIEQESFFRRLHPSGKIIALALVFVAALMLDHPLYMLALWAIAIPAGILSKGFKLLARLKFLFLAVCLASFILWATFTREGAPLFALGAISFTREGILFAAGNALRLGLMLFFGLCFIASTPIEDLYYGLVKLGVPFPVSFALSLSFRLVPIFSESAAAILQAQKSRGLKVSGNPLAKLKSYFPLSVPVFLSALRKVDQLSIALEARGFGAKTKRTSWIEFKFSRRDWLLLGLCLALDACCIGLRILGHGVVGGQGGP